MFELVSEDRQRKSTVLQIIRKSGRLRRAIAVPAVARKSWTYVMQE